MTDQEYRLQTTAAATQSAAVFMALIAVLALGLMGFAMGYAKAGKSSLIAHGKRASTPGVMAARVGLDTDRRGEFTLASVNSAAPAKPMARPVAVVAPVAVDAAPAAETIDVTPAPPAPLAEPATPQETTPISEPV